MRGPSWLPHVARAHLGGAYATTAPLNIGVLILSFLFAAAVALLIAPHERRRR